MWAILQGRLTPPDIGYQETPANWKFEFERLPHLGLDKIEWVITKKQLFNNPFFENDLSRLPISVVCVDNAVDQRIFEKGFFFDNVFPICEMSQEHGIETVAIPLLEDSVVDSKEKREKIIKNLIDCCDAFPDLSINIEAELDFENLLSIVSSHENLKITYDTGNMTALNFQHDLYIEKVFDKITNVHLKDRSFNQGTSKSFGLGDTDFELIFKTLSKLGYDKTFTLQMARGETNKEISHVKNISQTFRRMHAKHF